LQAPTLLVENKLFPPPAEAQDNSREPPLGPPWTIGWLGNLRCRRTLDELTGLARRHAGRVEVLIAGRPSPAVFDDLPAEIRAAPHCTFIGPYTTDQLADIYARCHFAWSVDWFEEGLNSSWLLPNRLYEAQAFGTVPIALRSVEVGRWLAQHGTGMLIDDDLGDLDRLLTEMTPESFAALRRAVMQIPRAALITEPAECSRLAAAMAGHTLSVGA